MTNVRPMRRCDSVKTVRSVYMSVVDLVDIMMGCVVGCVVGGGMYFVGACVVGIRVVGAAVVAADDNNSEVVSMMRSCLIIVLCGVGVVVLLVGCLMSYKINFFGINGVVIY